MISPSSFFQEMLIVIRLCKLNTDIDGLAYQESLIAQLLERPTGIWKAMGSTDHRPSGTQTFSLSHARDKMNISSLSLIQCIYHVLRKYVKRKFCIILLYDDTK